MGRMTMKSLALVAGMMVLAAAAGQAQAETRFAVQDSTGTVDKMVVTDTGAIGIGTSTPTYPFQIKAGGPAGATAMELRNTGRTAYSLYDAPNMQFTRNNDVTVNGGVPYKGDRLGLFAFGSWFGSTVRYGANIIAAAETSTGSATSLPAYISFETAAAPSAYPTERLRVTSTGLIGIGTSAPTQRLEVNGAIRMNTTAAKPTTCTAALRGTIWLTQGAVGAPDSLDVCLRDAAGNYAWAKVNN
jgi:hypothetical protein